MEFFLLFYNMFIHVIKMHFCSKVYEKIFYAYQGCIYLIKNFVKKSNIVKCYYNLK